ncbi:unnamed protein product [Urochloa decumbens]|uniref:Uncharacterized protein n=1 Tax=Urochloa decumbens TaxID=240449 RepID=A0ABC9F6R8_9POAL
MEALLPSSISPKMSAILQSHVYPRVGRVLRALARFKSMVLDALGKTTRRKKKKHAAISYRSRKRSKQVAASGGAIMKPPLAWSGGLSPSRAAALDANYHVYPSLESAWNAVVPAAAAGMVAGGGEDGAAAAAEYCGYLRWLEEEMPNDGVLVIEEDEEEEEDIAGAGGGNEIDRLAEKFIARCRARFLLEKQESYDRRCQEMIARSI